MNLTNPGLISAFRVLGIVLVALVALILPDVGPNRYWLVGTLLLVHLPVALWLHAKLPADDLPWAEPLTDLIACVLLIHFVPGYWHAGLVISTMVALAPSVNSSARSHLFYVLMGSILVCGYSFAGWLHDVDGWGPTMLAVSAVLPAVMLYAYLQARREDALRQRAQSLVTLTQLAGGVAHDFNNLLTSILGFAELARAELSRDHTAQEYIRQVINGANRASLLSSQLLSFSRRSLQTRQEFDIGTELRMLVTLLKPAIRNGVEINLDIADGLPNVQGDRGQLQQVLMNLILNASEATRQVPGQIHIRVGWAADGTDGLLIEVEDHGQGISAENLNRIFDPSFTTKLRGHGIGLASTRRIVVNHRGSIQIRSEPDRGTLVRVTLPTGDGPQSVEPERDPVTASRPETVLLIEDDATVRSVLTKLLTRIGHQPLEAENCERGLEQIADPDQHVDRIVLDLNMPGMDGWRCLDEIRKLRPELPVLICSGYDPDDQQMPTRHPNVRYLQKPFTLEALQRALSDD